jgi:hypothetical protein
MSIPGASSDRPIFPSIRHTIEKQDDLLERNTLRSRERRDSLLQTSTMAKDKETITLRGNLELLENVLLDIVSELKYHRQQVNIISAEKDTVGAVIQMGIAQAKNSALSEELRNQQEMRREERAQNREFERI